MNEIFTVGGFCFRLICPEGVTPPENFLKFRGGDDPSYTYTVTHSGDFPPPAGAVLARRADLLVTEEEGLERRWIGVRGNPAPYACYRETAPDGAEVFLDAARLGELNIDPVFASLLALERRQAALDALVLHCTYVEYRGQAILFSAPSETGKTTQANLWEKHRGARTVNGDRGLLQKLGGRWHARGWPVCGTSGVCHNRDLPIRAVVMLSQAPQDRAEPLGAMKAFTQLYSQITVNRWNRAQTQRAMELIEDLVGSVPVYHLACTMNETAVEALEAALGSPSGRAVSEAD